MKPAWLTWQKAVKKVGRAAGFSAIVFAFALYAGCATLIRVENDNLRRVSLLALPADREAYLFMDVASSRGIFAENKFFPEKILDNLEYLYVAAGTDPTAPEWTVIGTGRVPVGTYSLALDFDPKWKRVKGTRWVSSGGDMEIALPGPQFIVAGARDTDLIVDRLSDITPREDHPAKDFFETILENSHPGVAAYFLELDGLLPVELPAGMLGNSTLLVLGDFLEEVIHADLLFTFETPVKARVAGLVIRMISIAESRNEEGGFFAGAEVTVEGETVAVSAIEIGESQVSDLIGSVLSNSGENE